jgi:hypothetical protein
MFRHDTCNDRPVVLGLGDPVMDVLMHVNYDFLHTIAQQAGGCVPITYDELGHLTALGARECEPVRYLTRTIFENQCIAWYYLVG